MTTLHGPARRLTVYLGESDTWQHKPTYTEIVHRAHAAGLAGASVLRGIEGFGTSQRIHTSRLLSLSEDLPVVVVIVDAPEKVDAFLPVLDELVTEGLVTIEDVTVHVHRYRRSPGSSPGGSSSSSPGGSSSSSSDGSSGGDR